MLLIFQDLAILSDDITKCEQDIQESQNTKQKFQCVSPFNKKVDHLLPLTENECKYKRNKISVKSMEVFLVRVQENMIIKISVFEHFSPVNNSNCRTHYFYLILAENPVIFVITF